MKHGEQLAPLIERVLLEAGVVRQDLTALAVGTGPGPFTGLRVGLVTARTLAMVLEIPAYGVCSLDAIALEAADGLRSAQRTVRGGDRRAAQGGLPGGVRRAGHRASPAPSSTSRPRWPPTCRSPARARCCTPSAFTRPVGPALPSAGWLARGCRRGAGRADRPRAALPAAARRGGARVAEEGLVTFRPADRARRGRGRPARAGLPRRRRLVTRPGGAGHRRRAADRLLPGGRAGRRVVGSRGGERRGDDAELQRIAVDPAYRRRGLASELLAAVETRVAADGATRLLLEVREDNATAAAFYESRGFEELGRRRDVLPGRCRRGGPGEEGRIPRAAPRLA